MLTREDYADIKLTFAQNSAFAEFKTLGGFQAAVAANPHKIGEVEDIYVEERRPAGGSFPRGGGNVRGGARGDFNRPAGQGRGNFNKDAPRGGFTGGRGRGSLTPRGRGASQAA
jgi:hypothetical protein